MAEEKALEQGVRLKNINSSDKIHEDDNFITVTAAEEAVVIRKIDLRILPLVLAIYTLSILDRSNLGNARVAGLGKSVDLTGSHYAWLGTTFYVAYILSQWTALGWKQFSPHVWVTIVTLAWSSISSLQASVQNYAGLVVLRFLLGAAEAMFAGAPLYLSFFYPRDKLGLRQGIFLSGSALANAYGGALAYAITGVKGKLAPWQSLFLIEGLPTFVIAAAAWFFLPDDIAGAKFLNERDKEIAFQYMKRGQVVDTGSHFGVRFNEWRAAFLDYRSYIPGVMYFSCNVCFASLPLFVPTIIKEMGKFTSQQSNGLSAPPYLLAFFVIITAAFLSDRFKIRGPFVGIPALTAAIGFILLATTSSVGPRYTGVFLAVQIFVSIGILLPWVSNTHATESKRAGGWSIFATMGQCGPLVGTNIFPTEDGPYFRKGMWISCGFCLLVAVGSLLFSLILNWENKRMDKVFNEQGQSGEEDGEREKGFRYII